MSTSKLLEKVEEREKNYTQRTEKDEHPEGWRALMPHIKTLNEVGHGERGETRRGRETSRAAKLHFHLGCGRSDRIGPSVYGSTSTRSIESNRIRGLKLR